MPSNRDPPTVNDETPTTPDSPQYPKVSQAMLLKVRNDKKFLESCPKVLRRPTATAASISKAPEAPSPAKPSRPPLNAAQMKQLREIQKQNADATAALPKK